MAMGDCKAGEKQCYKCGKRGLDPLERCPCERPRHMRWHEGGSVVFLCDKNTMAGNADNTTTDWKRVNCDDCEALKSREKRHTGEADEAKV